MKNRRITQLLTFIAALAWMATACTSGQQQSQEAEATDGYFFSLDNTGETSRVDEGIIVTRQDLENLTAAIPEGMVPRLQDTDGNDLPSQTDDLDGDGQWDELAFLATLPGKNEQLVQVTFVEPSALPTYPVRTNIRFAKKPLKSEGPFVEMTEETRPAEHTKPKPTIYYQMEGPAWENDLVGFRLYFDPRNGKDIFGKQTKEMVMDEVGLEENYHELQSWGMDILKVGNSLGAGALAMEVEGQMYRLTGCEEVTFDIVAEGPVRSIFRLSYTNWPVAGNTYQLIEDISIWAGRHCYESKVTVTGLQEAQKLVTGIVNLQSEEMAYTEHNPGFVSIATHDNQAYDGEKLGMAVMVPREIYLENGQTPEEGEGEGITETFYTTMRLENAKPVTFWFYAGWEKQEAGFADQAYFMALLQREADRRANPTVPKKAQPAS